MKKLSLLLCLLTISVSLFGESIYAAKFGSTPLADVKAAAQDNLATSGITSQNEFAAIILAPTYPEVGDPTNLDKTPIPMALGRSDTSISNGYKLWVDGQTGYNERASSTASYRRIHWNAGIGLWQLDGSGLGQGYSLKQAIYTDTAASKVAARMASLYKNASGTAAQKRAAAWKPWFGCGSTGSTCESIFQSLYSSSNQTLNVTTTSLVTRSGGLQTTSCKYIVPPSNNNYFTCYKYDSNQVEGSSTDKNVFWLNANADGGTNSEPLPKPFYSFIENQTEYKHWLTSDTGYTMSRYASWDMQSNPRGSVYWYSISSPLTN